MCKMWGFMFKLKWKGFFKNLFNKKTSVKFDRNT